MSVEFQEIDKKVLKHRDSGGNTPNSRTERSNSNATSLLTNPSPVKTSSSSQNVNSSTTTPTTKSPSQSNTSNHPRALSVPGSLKTTFKDTVIADYDYEGQVHVCILFIHCQNLFLFTSYL